jgi:hypothetical protein
MCGVRVVFKRWIDNVYYFPFGNEGTVINNNNNKKKPKQNKKPRIMDQKRPRESF